MDATKQCFLKPFGQGSSRSSARWPSHLHAVAVNVYPANTTPLHLPVLWSHSSLLPGWGSSCSTISPQKSVIPSKESTGSLSSPCPSPVALAVQAEDALQ